MSRPEEALPDSAELASLTALVGELLKLREEREVIERQVSEMRRREEMLELELIPSTMTTIGVEKIRTTDGHEVTVAQDIQCSVGGKNKDVVIEWLDEVEAGDLVKTALSVSFGRQEREEASRIAALVLNEGHEAALSLSVHPGTFKAFLRERLEQGTGIPWERLSARAFEKAKIK